METGGVGHDAPPDSAPTLLTVAHGVNGVVAPSTFAWFRATLPAVAAQVDIEAPSVLVVDDEESVHEVFSRLFAKLGYRFDSARTAEEGLARLSTKFYDVLLIDKNLPQQSGVSLARAARRSQPNAVLILITGFASRASADELVGIADEYLTKPFELDAVRDTVAALLARRGSTRASPVPQRPTSDPAQKWVHLATGDVQEEEVLSAICKALHAQPTVAEVLPEEIPDVLVLAAARVDLETRKLVWGWQAQTRRLRVVLIVDPSSSADAAAAVALKAGWRLSRPLDRRTAQVIMQRALE